MGWVCTRYSLVGLELCWVGFYHGGDLRNHHSFNLYPTITHDYYTATFSSQFHCHLFICNHPSSQVSTDNRDEHNRNHHHNGNDGNENRHRKPITRRKQYRRNIRRSP